uniref:ANIS5_cation-bd domain-containing protein n=1 Tax=Haemonchus contortus TaxID=6289 RepID=A0A7I4YH27_HAECO
MKLLISFLFFAVTAAQLHYYWNKFLHPEFLMDVSRESRLNYLKVIFNKTLTIAEQKEKLRTWAKKNNVTRQVENLMFQVGTKMLEANENVGKMIDALSKAFKILTENMKNENQSMPQMKKNIEKLKQEQPSVYNVLKFVVKQVMLEMSKGRAKITDGPNGLQIELDKRDRGLL